jgi:hypothetical protein
MALEEAHKRDLSTVALLGYDGGEILRKGLADFPLLVRCDYIPRIQEVQLRPIRLFAKRWRYWIVARLEHSTARCPHTPEMRDWLEFRRCDFVEYDAENDPADRRRMRELTGGQRNVPLLPEDGKVLQVGWQGTQLHRRCRKDARDYFVRV